MKTSLGTIACAAALAASSSLAFAGGKHGSEDVVGAAGKASNVTRTVTVDMTDTMRFNPASLAVKRGETIRFVVKNSGAVKHEFVIGSEKDLKEHYAMMMKMPEMEHAEANQVTLAPGKTGEVIWQFTKAGKVDFACLQPGHYDAGMKGYFTVAAAGDAGKADGHDKHKH